MAYLIQFSIFAVIFISLINESVCRPFGEELLGPKSENESTKFKILQELISQLNEISSLQQPRRRRHKILNYTVNRNAADSPCFFNPVSC